MVVRAQGWRCVWASEHLHIWAPAWPQRGSRTFLLGVLRAAPWVGATIKAGKTTQVTQHNLQPNISTLS